MEEEWPSLRYGTFWWTHLPNFHLFSSLWHSFFLFSLIGLSSRFSAYPAADVFNWSNSLWQLGDRRRRQVTCLEMLLLLQPEKGVLPARSEWSHPCLWACCSAHDCSLFFLIQGWHSLKKPSSSKILRNAWRKLDNRHHDSSSNYFFLSLKKSTL